MSKTRLIDGEVNCLVYYSVSLIIFGLLAAFNNNYKQDFKSYYQIALDSATFFIFASGVLGAIQGCGRNSLLALVQIIGLSISMALTIYIEFFEIISNISTMFYVWGYDGFQVIILLWLLACQIIIIGYLALGIVFANRVRDHLSLKQEIHSSLL